jgi:hypothetical protein
MAALNIYSATLGPFDEAAEGQILFFLDVSGETDWAMLGVIFAPPNSLTMNKIKRFASPGAGYAGW